MPRGGYRRHSDEFKRAAVARTEVDGTSVSLIARELNINTNQLFSWRKRFGGEPLADGNAPSQLVAVTVLDTPPVCMPSSCAAWQRTGQVKATADRRYFGAWGAVKTRQAIFKIVKGCVQSAVDYLQAQGQFDEAIQLRKTSPHWMRHTFAKGVLLQGHDLRQVATALGHTSLNTTMIYTEQDALDQIRAWEQNRPGTLAEGTS